MAKAPASEYNGVVAVDKPGGMTSHDVVGQLRRIYGTRRVGHAGTLDPIATGVLVVCLGRATRILEYLAATRKRYTAGVLFGVRTDSQDITGQELSRHDTGDLCAQHLESVLERFRGPILQIPPMHSALHHEGQRLYELGRRGVEVERAARPVTIFDLTLIEFGAGANSRAHAVLDVTCSTGTYIRTLAADIGEAVGTGAVMDSLRRTEVGSFGLDRSFTLERLAEIKAEEGLSSTVIGIADALGEWRRVTLNRDDVAAVRQGRRLFADPAESEGPSLLVDECGEVVALSRIESGKIIPLKVFPAEA